MFKFFKEILNFFSSDVTPGFMFQAEYTDGRIIYAAAVNDNRDYSHDYLYEIYPSQYSFEMSIIQKGENCFVQLSYYHCFSIGQIREYDPNKYQDHVVYHKLAKLEILERGSIRRKHSFTNVVIVRNDILVVKDSNVFDKIQTNKTYREVENDGKRGHINNLKGGNYLIFLVIKILISSCKTK